MAELERQLIVERAEKGLAKTANDERFPGRPRVDVGLDKYYEMK